MAIESVIEGLQSLLDKYRNNEYLCEHSHDKQRNQRNHRNHRNHDSHDYSFECGSFLFGALTKQMDAHGLLSPRPEVPFPNYSFDGICSKLRTFKSPSWAEPDSYNNHDHGQQDRGLCEAVDKVIAHAVPTARGLNIASLKKATIDIPASHGSKGKEM
jgi:hypothetical protein